jgi:hypothetical protein
VDRVLVIGARSSAQRLSKRYEIRSIHVESPIRFIADASQRKPTDAKPT